MRVEPGISGVAKRGMKIEGFQLEKYGHHCGEKRPGCQASRTREKTVLAIVPRMERKVEASKTSRHLLS